MRSFRFLRSIAKPAIYYAFNPRELWAREVIVTTNDGTRFWCSRENAIERSLIETKTWELNETELVRRIIKQGDVVLDIGSNIGYYSFLMSKLGAEVHCFEPTSYAVNRFMRNLALNGGDIAFNKVGLLSRPVTRVEAIESRFSAAVPSYSEAEEMTFTTIDDYCKDFERLDFIKIDIDGYDYEAIQGGQETIGKHRPVILAEFCERVLLEKRTNVVEYAKLFLSLGYDDCIVASAFEQKSRLIDLLNKKEFAQDSWNIIMMSRADT